MGKWKQKLRFFGGPLDGEFHEVDEGCAIHAVHHRIDDEEPQVFSISEEGLALIPDVKVTMRQVTYERCYLHQQYRNGTGRAWPHMLITGEERQGTEREIEDTLKAMFDMLFGDTSRQML